MAAPHHRHFGGLSHCWMPCTEKQTGAHPNTTDLLLQSYTPWFVMAAPCYDSRVMNQRDMMRQLISKHGRKPDVVCREYAKAEQRGDVERKSDKCSVSPEGLRPRSVPGRGAQRLVLIRP